MIAVLQAELLKLTRRRVLVWTATVVLIASVLATILVFLSARSTSSAPSGNGPPLARLQLTLASLGRAGGGTQAFATGMAASGLFVFVLLTASWAIEFSQGTFRTLLMKQPRRLSLLAGKLIGLLIFAAAVLLVAEATVLLASLVLAPARGVSTAAWFSLDGMRDAAGNYANALAGVAAWASFGMALAVVLRSTPLALAAGIAWAGPFEHLTQAAWKAAGGWYPGLLLESLAVGGTSDVPYGRVIALLAIYLALAIAVASLSFARRDITA